MHIRTNNHMPTRTGPINVLVLTATCVQRVQRQRARFITGEYINVLLDPRREFLVLYSNNFFNLIDISYIVLTLFL